MDAELALRRRVTPAAIVLAALVLWTLVPLFTLLGHSGTFNGGYGVDLPDLVQYMAFIHDAGQHLLISSRFEVVVAIALALAFFYFAPGEPLSDWLGGNAFLQFGTQVVALEMFAAAYAWGTVSAISIALVPVFRLAVERVLDPTRRARGRSARWYMVWAGLAGMTASWLDPWQGITLLAIVAGLVLWADWSAAIWRSRCRWR